MKSPKAFGAQVLLVMIQFEMKRVRLDLNFCLLMHNSRDNILNLEATYIPTQNIRFGKPSFSLAKWPSREIFFL